MRHLTRGLIFAAILAAPCHAAPAAAKSWQEAVELAKSGGRDILVFVHGSDWNRLGEKFRTQIWDNPEFLGQLGDDMVTLRIDFLESPTEEQKKGFDEAVKGFKVGFPSYPVLAFHDPAGRRCAIWTGSTLPLMASEAASMVNHMRTQRKTRDALLEQAANAEGTARAETLYLAAETGAGLRAEIIKQLKECDPDDQSGYLGLLEFNGHGALGHANKLAGEKKFDEALAWLDEQMQRKRLTTEQKQWILAAKGNVYRRWGDHLDEMGAAFTAARDLDPTSVVGKASHRFALRFTGPPSLEFGWAQRHCTAEPTTWQVAAGGAFDQAGAHQLTLQHRGGKSALTISAVALYDGERLIHEDKHEGTTGHQSKDNVYRFPVASPLADPVLHIHCHSDANKDGHGTILVEPVAP